MFDSTLQRDPALCSEHPQAEPSKINGLVVVQNKHKLEIKCPPVRTVTQHLTGCVLYKETNLNLMSDVFTSWTLKTKDRSSSAKCRKREPVLSSSLRHPTMKICSRLTASQNTSNHVMSS